jgi:hypothetical protein
MAQSDSLGGGTAVDFGTAHVIHRSVIPSPTVHRCYQAKAARSVNEHDFKPAKHGDGRNEQSRIVVSACRSNLADV